MRAHEDTVLTPSAAQAYYDRFGSKQDSQGFYEDAALDDLIANADFGNADHVFEFGCGTGKFAARLLASCLPASASYLGGDLSPVMVRLATARVAPYGGRATVRLFDGAIQFPVPTQSMDRVIACYVLDLLSDAAITDFFAEAWRALQPGGRVCIASLTRGVNLRSRVVASLWTALFRLSPSLVGGCRPIHLAAWVEPQRWRIVHQHVVTPFGVPSEILILEKKDDDDASSGPAA